MKRIIIISLFCISSVNAGVIGTFDMGSNFNPFGTGNFFGDAHSALVGDGHSLTDLGAGDLATNLAAVDIAYLPFFGSQDALTAAQTTTIYNYVAAGGALVVQADHNSYDNLLGQFGVSVGSYAFNGTQSIINPYAPLTNGPHGVVNNIHVASAFQLTVPAGGSILDASNTLGVLRDGHGLGAGFGDLIVFGEINMFDGPGNFNGITKDDNLALWRNTFELSGLPVIPAPSAIFLTTIGGAVVGWLRRRRTI